MVARGHGDERALALARVEEAFAGFVARSSLPRLRDRISAEVGAGVDVAGLHMLARIGSSGPLRATYLAERSGLDVSTVSRRIAELEDAGLVARTRDPDDRRARILQVTAKGRRVLATFRKARSGVLDDALSDWSAEEIRDLAATLSRFTAALAETV
jgi:DNA-binding MarR family transcriptional regulator